VAIHQLNQEATSRSARMLRTALGPAIALWLEDASVVEVMLNPDGRLWMIGWPAVSSIPQGTRLIGVYDSQVAAGQSRVLLVWTRLIMPNGRSIVLERQTGDLVLEPYNG
jgi:hypothetical protein